MSSSIAKTLNLRTYFSINRIPKLTPLSPSSDRVLSTLAESPVESSFQPQEKKSWSRYLLFLPGAITFGLGTWQIFRRQDKVEMLDYRRNRLGLDPVVLNNISSSSSSGDSGSLEFRRVMCEGIFDESKSIYVGPRSRSISGVTENGYYVITPLVPNSSDPKSVQSPVLVNRGWVPRSWREKHQKDSQNVEPVSSIKTVVDGETEGSSRWKFWSKKPITKTVEVPIASTPSVQVIGVIRGSENPSIFVPANDPSSGQWFYVDVPAIARAAGLPEDTLYLEDINDNVDHGNPYPLPKDVNTLIRSSTMPQDHLNYTLTWYSLSAAVTFMAVKRLKPKKIRR
ncbi:hypothetical protein MKW94_025596 [Papaver nudicaule]|uniref:SURF1-like protein n=1 Tax=Papaver nudicaule TaxID=74823 RepID=A0AA41VKU5_PAPNU|nr:hypothetical protein [Papaver nudicaule]